MSELQIGQHVITEHGEGVIDTITPTRSADDILRYRILSGTEHHWHYLDELIAVDNTASR